MMSLPGTSRNFALILLPLLLAAQLFGVTFGFVCHCDGASRPAATPECHTDVCHPGSEHSDSEEPAPPHEEQKDELEALALTEQPRPPRPLEISCPPVWEALPVAGPGDIVADATAQPGVTSSGDRADRSSCFPVAATVVLRL